MYFRRFGNETRDGVEILYQVTSLLYGLPEASRKFYKLSAVSSQQSAVGSR